MRKTGLEVWAGRWLVTESRPLSAFGCGALKPTARSTSLEGQEETKLTVVSILHLFVFPRVDNKNSECKFIWRIQFVRARLKACPNSPL